MSLTGYKIQGVSLLRSPSRQNATEAASELPGKETVTTSLPSYVGNPVSRPRGMTRKPSFINIHQMDQKLLRRRTDYLITEKVLPHPLL